MKTKLILFTFSGILLGLFSLVLAVNSFILDRELNDYYFKCCDTETDRTKAFLVLMVLLIALAIYFFTMTFFLRKYIKTEKIKTTKRYIIGSFFVGCISLLLAYGALVMGIGMMGGC